MPRRPAEPLGLLGDQRIERRSTTAQVAGVLREAVMRGTLLPGTPLREVALAAEFGVSRSTVREAARLLQSEGLVDYEMNRGIVVTDLTDRDIDELYQAREALELAGATAFVTGFAAASVNGSVAGTDMEAVDAELAELVEVIENAVATRDVDAALAADRRFHAALVDATGNGRLRAFHDRVQQELRLALALAERSAEELGRSGDDHRALLTALRGGSVQAAADAVRAHLAAGAAELHRLRELVNRRRTD